MTDTVWAFGTGVVVGATVLVILLTLFGGLSDQGALRICQQIGYPRVAYVDGEYRCEKKPELMPKIGETK